MKIAFLNISYGKVERGAERFVEELSKRLKEKGIGRDIITANEPYMARWPIIWRSYLDPFGIQVAIFTLKNLGKLWKEKYDVVIPIDGGWQPAFVRIVTWLYGGKVVISGQSGKGWDDRNNLWCFPDAFVALSSKLMGWAKGANPLVRVVRIPNGVDIHKFRPEGEKIDIRLEAPIILSVGALDKDKRMDLVIKAVAKLGRGSLLIAGKGPKKFELEELGERLLGKRFQIVSLDFEEMPKLYRRVDLFTLASPWFRSFEMVIVEAMATNLPVVVNDDEIRKEIVGEAGIFVDPTNTKEYASALRSVLDKDWGDSPRRQAEKFDWKEIVQKYEQLFINLGR